MHHILLLIIKTIKREGNTKRAVGSAGFRERHLVEESVSHSETKGKKYDGAIFHDAIQEAAGQREAVR